MEQAPGRSQEGGFTLIELVVTISILVILASLALPSFLQTIRESRVATTANNLLSLLTLARSEAIKRNLPVGLCATADGALCQDQDTAGWHQGVLAYVDTDDDGEYDHAASGADAESLIAVQYPLSKNITIASNLGASLTYQPDGRASPQGTFDFTPTGASSPTRRLTVAWTGRPSVCKPAGGC